MGSRPKINFRKRWKAQTDSRADDMSFLDEIVSQSAGSDGSWSLVQIQEEKRRAEQQDIQKNLQFQRKSMEGSPDAVAAVARLTAMQQLRKSDLKMPWEKGPLASIFAPEAAATMLESSTAMPRVGLADTLAPLVSTKKEEPVISTTASTFARKRIAASKFVIKEDELLARCFNQIKTLILTDLAATEVGTVFSKFLLKFNFFSLGAFNF